MTSLWKWRLILVAPLTANTANNRTALATIFANESGESIEDERKMFDGAAKLALGNSPLVHAGFGISTPVKQTMRDDLQSWLDTYNAGVSGANRIQWYAIAAIDLENFNRGELIASSRNTVADRIGTQFRPRDVLDDLNVVILEDVL